MTRARRPLIACAALALAVSLGGCSLLGESDEQDAVPTVSVPNDLPATFAKEARWAVTLGTDTKPAATDEGIAAILPGRTSSSLYRVALLSPSDGSTRWVSDDFENPSPNVVPTVSTTTVSGEPWVVVKTQVSGNEVQLDSYSPAGTGDRRVPDTSTKVKGADDDTLPSVTVRPEGVVVSDTENPGLSDWKAKVKNINNDYKKAKAKAKKEKKDAPKKPSTPDKPNAATLVFDPAEGETTAYKGPGTLSSAWAEGYVVSDPSEKSGFGYTVGDDVAWESSTSRPSNTDREDKGTLLAPGPGLLLAEWEGSDGNPVLAVHEIRTGKVLSVQGKLDTEAVEESHGQPLVQSDDGKWASWGQYVFGLKGGQSSQVDLHGGTVRTIYQDVLYVEDATEPLTASAAAERSASPEPEPTETDSEGEESSAEAEEPTETFDGMIDASTGEPLTNKETDAVPQFVSNASQGVFVLSADGKTRLYSTPLS